MGVDLSRFQGLLKVFPTSALMTMTQPFNCALERNARKKFRLSSSVAVIVYPNQCQESLIKNYKLNGIMQVK